MPFLSVDEIEVWHRRFAEGETAKRELESIQRNVKDVYDALEGKTFADAQSVRRLLRSTLPWEMTRATKD